MGITTAVTNCVKYSSDNTPFCLECATGYYVDTTTSPNSCIATCPAGTVCILDNLDGYINVCVTNDNVKFSAAFTTGAKVVARVSFGA